MAGDIVQTVEINDWPKEYQAKVMNWPKSSGNAVVAQKTVLATGAEILLAENQNRIKAIVQNGVGVLYVKLGVDASEDSHTFRLVANERTPDITGYLGVITARKDGSGSTKAMVTEIS